MFMGDEKEGNALAFVVARERATRDVLSTVGPRKSTGQWMCRRPMAWLREIGLEFVDIIVKSDNEWIEDDHQEQSSGLFEEQRDSRESHSVGAGNDQNNTQLD